MTCAEKVIQAYSKLSCAMIRTGNEWLKKLCSDKSEELRNKVLSLSQNELASEYKGDL